jgi:hypothetical protein
MECSIAIQAKSPERKMKVKKWWLAARNRESWRNILREAEAHSGL